MRFKQWYDYDTDVCSEYVEPIGIIVISIDSMATFLSAYLLIRPIMELINMMASESQSSGIESTGMQSSIIENNGGVGSYYKFK